MCGLAGIHRRGDKLVPKIDRLANELLLAIEQRGTDATGFLSLMDTGLVQLEKKVIPASRFVHQRGRLKRNARTVLLHTRFATRGAREDIRNAHPVASGRVAAIHNGTISNADHLFSLHKLPRVGRVDSEIIPALVDATGWGDKDIGKALSSFTGGAATAIVHTEYPQEVILARVRNYPLVYAATEDVIVWASTAAAIRQAWFRTYGQHLPVEPVTMLEGTVLRVNGSIARLPKLKQPKLPPLPQYPRSRGFAASRGGWSGDLQAWADEKPRPKKSKKARGGKGMPRAFPSLASTYGLPGDLFWEGDDLKYVSPDEDVEADILDLMAEGLTRAEATEIVREAVEWSMDDPSAASAAVLRGM
jgi:amidophosphoribosyltransferase